MKNNDVRRKVSSNAKDLIKVPKQRAWEALIRVIDLVQDIKNNPSATTLLDLDIQDIDRMVIQDLPYLYKKFMPPLPKVKKVVGDWLYSAASGSRDCREFLRYIYSDGKKVMAADGHRIHMIPIKGKIPEGYYDRHMIKIHEHDKWQYPAINHIAAPKPNTKTINMEDVEMLKAKNPYGHRAEWACSLYKDHFMNYKYLQDALNGAKTFTLGYNKEEPKSSVIVIPHHENSEFQKSMAIIMPLTSTREEFE